MWNQSAEFHHNEQEALVDKAYKRALEVLARDQIQLSQFSDLYGPERIARDEAYVKQRKLDFENSSESEKHSVRLATVFEAILHEHGELSNWFGDMAETVRVSDLDNIANGVDMGVEFTEEKSHSYLALAVDATYSQFPDSKLNRIKDEIDRGEMGKITYALFSSGVRGELTKVPRVIVGVSPSTILHLSELWLSNRSTELGAHPVQFQILESILMQAETFAKYARSIERPDIAEKYERISGIVGPILKDKQKKMKDSGERDDVFVALDLGMRRFKKENI